MECKLKLILFVGVLAMLCEAEPARIRFGNLTCLQRVHQATLGLTPLTAVRESYIASYLNGAMSFYDLGKRFRALASGIYRNFYPDLDTIASLLEHADRAKLGGTPAFHVGIRDIWRNAVERPVRSWVAREFYYGDTLNHPAALIEYEIEHTDGSRSHIYAFHHGVRMVSEKGRDSRPILNVFVTSHGPTESRPTIAYRAGNPIEGKFLLTTPLDATKFQDEITALKDTMIERRQPYSSIGFVTTAPTEADGG